MATNRRLLVCDDETGIIDAYRRILADLVALDPPAGISEFDALSAELFGEVDVKTHPVEQAISEIVYCQQGEAAVAAFAEAYQSGEPFAAVFLDVRMPPGIDGVEAARRMRTIDPNVNIVMVTGYSDHRPSEIAQTIGAADRVFYLVKPFNADEIRQLATTLVNRWAFDVRAASELDMRVRELEALNRALKNSEASAHRAARHDPLTGLLNRMGLDEQFQSAVLNAARSDRTLALLYVDLDRFKLVNDTYGHSVGDRMICDVATRILRAVGEAGFAARLGGDEFAVICFDTEMLPAMLEQLLDANGSRFDAGSHQLSIGLSIGYTYCRAIEGGLSEAMRQADIALYTAKASGRGVAREFDGALDKEFLYSQRLAEDLKDAIENNVLMLHYQPLMSADGHSVTGVEALLRWNHREYGSVPPQAFVAVAEQSNLIVELGDWVLKRALRDARLWPDLITSINLSAIQLTRSDFAEKVVAIASSAAIDPAMIEFELTETTLSQDHMIFLDQIQKLKDAGFRLALDDFGTGYAGIGYLRQLQFDKLKIDRSFVSNLLTEPKSERIIRSIIDLGLAMGLTVTAEGVEEVYQHKLLLSAGCQQMQGYLFHRPVEKEAVLEILARQRRDNRAA